MNAGQNEKRTAAPATSRRRFLQASTATMIGAGLALDDRMARCAHAAAGDVGLRLGLVGCGGRGRGAVVNALTADPHARLVALADVFADHVEQSIDALGKTPVAARVSVDPDHQFSGFDAYQKLIASDVDVVLLATPPHFRPLHLKACIDAGKHVFAEKPVAVDAPGVRAVLAACEQARQKNVSVVSGLMYRYDHALRETIQRIHDGAIGDIVAIQTTYNVGPPWFRNKEREPDWTEMQYQMRNWYPFTWLSGDHNVEQHIHSLDRSAWSLQDRPPQRAWGSGGRQFRDEPAIGTMFDHHCVTYEYDDGTRVFSHCRRQAGCANDISDHVLGAKGRANLLKYRIDGETNWQYKGPKPNGFVAEHEALFRAIREGQPINNGLYMAYSTLWAILGRMATYTGQTITWDQALNSQEDLSPERYAWDAQPPVLPDERGNYPLAMPGITKFI